MNLGKPEVLCLNSLYQRIGWTTPKKAIIAMNGGNDGSQAPAQALNIIYALNTDGTPNLKEIEYFEAVNWEKWITLEIPSWHRAIHTSKASIRIPTVIVCSNYDKMPMKQQRPTTKAILDRDGWKCVYTGVALTKATASLDHVMPKSRGGRDTWENLVAAEKGVNSRKSNLTPKEAGLPEPKKRSSPKAIPISQLIREVRHADHLHFMQD